MIPHLSCTFNHVWKFGLQCVKKTKKNHHHDFLLSWPSGQANIRLMNHKWKGSTRQSYNECELQSNADSVWEGGIQKHSLNYQFTIELLPIFIYDNGSSLIWLKTWLIDCTIVRFTVRVSSGLLPPHPPPVVQGLCDQIQYWRSIRLLYCTSTWFLGSYYL